MINGTCWNCMLPIRLLGGMMNIGSASGSGSTSPDGASTSPQCMCLNRDQNGVPNPSFGLTAGSRNPEKLMEVVNEPWCFPSLGGISFNDSDGDGNSDEDSDTRGISGAGLADALMLGGAKSQSRRKDGKSNITFYNTHYIHFPLLSMLDALVDSRCAQDGFMDFDIGYMSEVDLAWNDDEVGAILSPDGGAFATLPAVSSCAIDAVSSTIGDSIDSMYWCAGSWGSAFPLNGYISQESSYVQSTSLVSYKMLFKMHRLGQVRESYGSEDAMCGKADINVTPIKQAWKTSMVFPVSQSKGDCCNNIGESTMNWGEWRSYPGEGTNAAIYMMWKYTECCITY